LLAPVGKKAKKGKKEEEKSTPCQNDKIGGKK
jgi:hypothetical protein